MQSPPLPTVIIAIPAYDNRLDIGTVYGLLSLKTAGLDFKLLTLSGDSLVTRARNRLASKFLEMKHPVTGEPYDKLMFIDSDICFKPKDLLRLLGRKDMDIVAGCYPKKRIFWNKLKDGLKSCEKEEDIEPFLLDYMFYPILQGEKKTIKVDKSCCEVKQVCTGFTLIDRKVFTKMRDEGFADTYKSYGYSGAENGGEEYDWFKVGVKDGVYLSEDYWFCQIARKLGFKIYVDVDIDLTHSGIKKYNGSMSKLIRSQIKSKKNTDE